MFAVLCGFALGAATVWWSVAVLGPLLRGAAEQLTSGALDLLTRLVAATPLEVQQSAAITWVLTLLTPALVALLLLALGRIQGVVRPVAALVLLAVVAAGWVVDGITVGTVSATLITLILTLLLVLASAFIRFALAVLAGALAATGIRTVLDGGPGTASEALTQLTGVSWGVAGLLAGLAVVALPYLAVGAALLRKP